MKDNEFLLRVEISRLKSDRDQLEMRAARAESVLFDVITDLDTLGDRISTETAERVAEHREWTAKNGFKLLRQNIVLPVNISEPGASSAASGN